MPETILVVEDHEDIRNSLKALLTRQGFDVAVAVDGDDGLEKARAISPDLILTDNYMPGLDGLQMIAQLRQIPALSDVPIIVLSRDSGIERAAMAAGADRFLKKSTPFEETMKAIKQLLALALERHTVAEPGA